jgi:hypothetical protein
MPGRVNLKDLPPEVRRKLVGRAIRPAPASKARPTSDDDMPPRWRCHNCGAIYGAYKAAERHATQPGHRRIETTLGDW